MKLTSLEVRSLPGIAAPYALHGLGDGVTVVVAPNASGKSSLVRALRALLDPAVHAGEHVEVVASFVDTGPGVVGGKAEWRVSRYGPTIKWERGGVVLPEPPPTPPEHLLASYLVSVEDLMGGGTPERVIAERLQRELSGGYDLEGAVAAASRRVEGHQRAARELSSALDDLASLRQGRARLASRAAERASVHRRMAQAAESAAELPAYERALELAGRLSELAEARSRLGEYPAVLARLTGGEADDLRGLHERLERSAERQRAARARLREAAAAAAATGLAGSAVDAAGAARQERVARDLEELVGEAAELDRRTSDATARGATLWRQLGGAGPVAETAFSPEVLADVEAAVAARMVAHSEVAAARTELGAREEARRAAEAAAGDATDGGVSAADLRAARAALERWLVAASPADERSRLGPAVVAVLLSVGLVVAAAASYAVTVERPLAAWFGTVAGAVGASGPLGVSLALVATLCLLVATVLSWVTVATHRRDGRERAARIAERAAAQRAYDQSGAGPLGGREWSHTAVSARLLELVELTAGREGAARRAEAFGSLAREAERRLREAEARGRAADDKLAALAGRTGYDPGAANGAGAGFAGWLSLSGQLAGIMQELSGLAAARERLEGQADALAVELVERSAGTPFASPAVRAASATREGSGWRDSKLPHARELRQRAEELADAVTARDEAMRKAELARADLRREEEEAAATTLERAALLERCGVGGELGGAESEAAVAALVAALGPFAEARAEVQELQALVRADEAALLASQHSERLLALAAAGDRAEIEAAVAVAREAAVERDELAKQLGGLDQEVKEAVTGRALERKGAEVQRARDELEDLLGRAELNAATEVVMADVEREHATEHEPELLALAREWFGRFTLHAFELGFDRSAEATERFWARDTGTGVRLRLGELSTGTRAQLLLAVRVAHVTVSERRSLPGGVSVRLPFVLDEALTTADPRRFGEVASSLLSLAVADDRQVLYLSARAEDAVAWQRVAERAGRRAAAGMDGDLVTVVGLAGSINPRWLERVTSEPAGRLPRPGEVAAAEFVIAVGAAPLDPWQDVGAAHVLHVMWDDLEAVWRLAQAGVRTVGAADGLLRLGEGGADQGATGAGGTGPVGGVLGSASAVRLSRRSRAARVWLRAWREGRHRPVTVTDLVESGAVTAAFEEQVGELVRTERGDPEAILRALSAREVPNFRTANVEQMGEWLRENGFIAGMPPLEEHERIVRTARSLAGTEDGAELPADALAEARELDARLLAALA